MFCMQCGKDLPEGAKFCYRCGKPIEVGGVAEGPRLLELTCPGCAGRLGVSEDMTRFDCRHCGKTLVVLRQEHRVQVELAHVPAYERCKIRFRLVSHGNEGSLAAIFKSTMSRGCFYAEAIGPSGKFEAGVSNAFEYEELLLPHNYPGEEVPPRENMDQAAKAQRDFIARLTRDGWEPLGTSPDWWYQENFRRQVN